MGITSFVLSDRLVALRCLSVRCRYHPAREDEVKMLRRPMTRLASAVTVAGTICALGAGAAVAAPTISWHGPSRPVPGAITDASPALSTITFPNSLGRTTLVAWRGTGAGHVLYKYRDFSHWSKLGAVPGASTSSAPAFASYTDPRGRHAVLAVWTGRYDHHIWYSQGETSAKGTVSWTKPVDLPAKVTNTDTTDAPAVFFAYDRYKVIVAWHGPFNHVRYTIGTPAGRGFAWTTASVVPGTTAYTSTTPAVAEVQTGTSAGTLYAFWKQLGSNDIFYSTAADNSLTNWAHLAWTAPVQLAGAATLTAPAASSLGNNGFGPLLVAYKLIGLHVGFQVLTGSVWSGPGIVPSTRTTFAPALLKGLLATTTPAQGNIVFHAYY